MSPSRPPGLSTNHRNLLNAIKTLSAISTCRASDETLAKTLGVSPASIKRWLDDLQKLPENRPSRSKKRKRVPLGLGLIAHRKTSAFMQNGQMRQHRWIYIIDQETSAGKGANRVAAELAKFGESTMKDDERFCGPLQCTLDQFHEWLRIAQELKLVKVEHDQQGRRVITRIATGVSAVDLPDTLRRVEFIEVDGKTKMVSKSTWTPERDQSLAEKVRDLVQRECDLRRYCLLTNEQLAEATGLSERTVKRALAAMVRDRGVFTSHLGRGRARGRILTTSPLSEAERAALARERSASADRRSQEERFSPDRLASITELVNALRLALEVARGRWGFPLPTVTVTRKMVRPSLGAVQQFEVEEWAKKRAEEILSPLVRAHFDAVNGQPVEREELVREFYDHLRHCVDRLNLAWVPSLILPADSPAPEDLATADLARRAMQCAEDLHREHRNRTAPPGVAAQPGPETWIDPTVPEVNVVVQR